MFVGGLVIMIVGMIVWLPLGHDRPAVQMTGRCVCLFTGVCIRAHVSACVRACMSV